MLLPYILNQLDAELDRLHRLRTVIAALQRTGNASSGMRKPIDELPILLSTHTESSKTEQLPAQPPKPPAKRTWKLTKPRAPKANTRPATDSLPFKPAPSGVFVVSAQELERERALRAGRNPGTPETAHPDVQKKELAPETLARTLAARWLSGADGEARGS